MIQRKPVLLLRICVSLAMYFDGWAAQPPIPCLIPRVVRVDKADHSYGYHNCRRQVITGAYIWSIKYIDRRSWQTQLRQKRILDAFARGVCEYKNKGD